MVIHLLHSNICKQIIFGLFSFLGSTAYAANMIEISQNELTKADNTPFLLIDVRSEKEFADGHVPQAINIPLDKIAAHPDILNISKDMPIILYCRSGYRANKAGNILWQNGYTNLRHLKGDMLAWEKSGLPIEK